MNDKLSTSANFIGKLSLILGIFLAPIGKKRYFLALGKIQVTEVSFIGRKITLFIDFNSRLR